MADNIRATPRNPVLGLFSDITQGGLDYLRDPRFRQSMMQLPAPVRPFGMGAVALPGLFESTGFPKTLERAAYGEPLTNIGMANVPTLKPETADLLMNVAPLAPAALRNVAATARFVAPKAGQLAEQYMVRTGGILPLDVYHGTPHTLPPTPRNPLGEFDASKIGTGEGAQSYGLGIYTAEARPVAEEYAKNLANADRFNQGRLTAHANAKRLAELTGSPEYAADDIRFVLESNPDHEQKKLLTETLNFLESGDYKKPLENKGNLYKVDLPDEKIAQMIDYNKPMAEQRNVIEKMREALVGPDSPLSRSEQFQINDYLNDRVRMRNLYPQSVVNLNDPRIVERLRQVGIPGIKYLDEQSRRPGITSMTQAQLDTRIDILKKDIDSGLGNQDRMKQILSALEAERASHQNLTRNFVTFPGEEQNLRILERNSQRANELDYPSNPMYTDPLGYSIR